MAGERTVKIRFTGDAKGLDRAVKSAEKSMSGLNGAIESAGKAAAPAATAAVMALGAVIAPVLGAVLAGGILLALGGGILAVGIMAAAKDPGVSAAFGGLKKRAQTVLADFGKPFIEPLKRAADTFGDSLERMGPTINKIGAILAPVIDRLAPALAGFAEKALPGIASGVEDSVPLFDKLAELLPKMGEGLGNFIAKLGEFTTWVIANSDSIGEWIDILTPIAGIFLGIVAAIKIWIAVQTILNAVLLLNPIGLVVIAVAALIAIIVVIAQKTTWFQDAWKWAWGGIKSAASAVGTWFKDTLWGKWIKGAWDMIVRKGVEVLAWFQSVDGKIRSALAGVRDIITSPFRSAFNAIVRFWNGTVGGLSFTIPGWVPGIGGNSWTAPRLSERASGGPALAGRSYLVGERGPEIITMGSRGGQVIPNRELGAGGDVYEIHVDLGNAVKQVIRVENRDLKRRARARGAAVA